MILTTAVVRRLKKGTTYRNIAIFRLEVIEYVGVYPGSAVGDEMAK